LQRKFIAQLLPLQMQHFAATSAIYSQFLFLFIYLDACGQHELTFFQGVATGREHHFAIKYYKN